MRIPSQREYEEGERAGKWISAANYYEVHRRIDREQEHIEYKRRRLEQDRLAAKRLLESANERAANELAANIELAAKRYEMEMGH